MEQAIRVTGSDAKVHKIAALSEMSDDPGVIAHLRQRRYFVYFRIAPRYPNRLLHRCGATDQNRPGAQMDFSGCPCLCDHFRADSARVPDHRSNQRSQVLSLRHEAVQRGEVSSGVARERLRL